MAIEVQMPKLGLTMTEGKIVRWLKKEGDQVNKGEALLEVMTEKIVTEVESPESGTLVKIIRQENEVIQVTETIALIADEGEDWQELLENVVGSATAVQTNNSEQLAQASMDSGASTIQKEDPSGRVRISPLARKIAYGNNLSSEDFKKITGTGPLGRIVKKDVIKYLEQAEDEATTVEESVTEPLSDLRSAIASRMTQSFTTTPHFYLETEVDAENLLNMRKTLNEKLEEDEESISVNDLLVKMVAVTLKKHPYLNSSFSEKGIILHKQVNIGVAVAIEEGLIVPVIRDAPNKSLRDISKNSRYLISNARSGELSYEDVSGGTFTLSNLGMFAVDSFTAIINPPESAILAVGRVAKKPFYSNGEFVLKSSMRLNLGLDHRVLDGAQGARFLTDLKAFIENPILLSL